MSRCLRRFTTSTAVVAFGLLPTLFLSGFSGCSKKPVSETVEAVEVEKPAPVEETADVVMQKIVAGLKANQPEVLWQALPPSYQQDVNGLVRQFASKMDADTWNRSFATLKKGVTVFREKRQLILNNSTVQLLGEMRQRRSPVVAANSAGSPNATTALPSDTSASGQPNADTASASAQSETNAAAYNGVMGLLDILDSSQISDIEKLKAFDGGVFLKETGGKLMQAASELNALHPDPTHFKRFGESKFSIARTEGEVVYVTNNQVRAEPFVKVEGKWIPKGLADRWKGGIESANTSVANLSTDQIVQQKDAILRQLDQTDALLDQLAAAETQEQFDGIIEPQLEQVRMMAMLFGGKGFEMQAGLPPQGLPARSLGAVPAKPPVKVEPGQLVEVVATGDVGVEELIAMEANLLKVATLPDDYEFLKELIDGNWSFRFKCDVPLETIAGGISFGKVTAIDPEKHLITVVAGKPEK